MESKLLAAAAAAGVLGFALGRLRSRPKPSELVPDEERLAWLQRLSTVGQMMSGVLHEVRTPLSTVILTVEHAQRMLERGGDLKEPLKTIERESDRAVEILSDMLDFAKPSPLDLKPMDVRALLQEALEPLRMRFQERKIEVGLTAPEGLLALASSRHIHQVATILLMNALDAMPFGGRLDVHAGLEGDLVRIVIRDTGIGIEPEALAGLFQPFASGKTESGGTGLGLNVARWIMNKHGGDVSIASAGFGKGTSVTLQLRAA